MSPTELILPFVGPGASGGVTVAQAVIAKLAGTATRGTYGVVDMQEPPIRKLARVFRGSLSEGVEVDIVGDRASLCLHVVMERGVNIAQVTENLRDHVRYQVERVAGIPLAEIDVCVEDLQD